VLIIVAIDPAVKTGWVVRTQNGEYLNGGTWMLRPSAGEGAGMITVRLRGYLHALLDAYRSSGEVIVAYEWMVGRHTSTAAAHLYGALSHAIMGLCEELNVAYLGVPVATVKRLATGRGNAKKTDMIAAAKVRWPEWRASGEDEVDARWIAEAAALTLIPAGSTTG